MSCFRWRQAGDLYSIYRNKCIHSAVHAVLLHLTPTVTCETAKNIEGFSSSTLWASQRQIWNDTVTSHHFATLTQNCGSCRVWDPLQAIEWMSHTVFTHIDPWHWEAAICSGVQNMCLVFNKPAHWLICPKRRICVYNVPYYDLLYLTPYINLSSLPEGRIFSGSEKNKKGARVWRATNIFEQRIQIPEGQVSPNKPVACQSNTIWWVDTSGGGDCDSQIQHLLGVCDDD